MVAVALSPECFTVPRSRNLLFPAVCVLSWLVNSSADPTGVALAAEPMATATGTAGDTGGTASAARRLRALKSHQLAKKYKKAVVAKGKELVEYLKEADVQRGCGAGTNEVDAQPAAATAAHTNRTSRC